jgi:spermidine synthase
MPNAAPITVRRLRAPVAALFFASGAAGLIFEALWFRQATLCFGSSVWASSLVLSAFMTGLAFGGVWAARWGDRIRQPLRVYAGLEAIIAFSGVALVYSLPALGRWLAPSLLPLSGYPSVLHAARFGIAFALLLVPSTAMGATLPLIARALVHEKREFGSVLGLLYGVNTLGAVLGVSSAELLLVGPLGVRGAALAAGAANVSAGILALALARRAIDVAPGKIAQAARTGVAARARRLLAAAFLAGFTLLALEVVWLRILLLFLNSTALAFALVLAAVLAGIAGGGLIAGRWLAQNPSAHRHASALALLAGALGVLGLRAFPFVGSLSLAAGAQGTGQVLGLALPLVLPTSVASGALFGLLGAALNDELDSASRSSGAVAATNTLGSALGSLAAGFLLLPKLGMEKALLLLLVCYAAVAALVLRRSNEGRRALMAGAALYALSIALFPFGMIKERLLNFSAAKWAGTRDDRVVALREGLDATLMYVEHRVLGVTRHHQLLTNSYSMSTTAFPMRRYMKLYVYWPLALRPVVKSALVVGFGVGNTAKALTDSRELESIDVVDISSDILDLSRVVFPDDAEHPLRDPRVRVHVEDGRWFLQGTSRRFDLITGEPPPHDLAGVGNLYSVEYFRLLRERLNPGGVVSYWLHASLMSEATAKAIVRAFCDAFEDCSLWHGASTDLMLIGTHAAKGPVDEAAFIRQWRDARVLPELRALGLEKPEQLGALFIADASYLKPLVADTAPASDDFPHRLLLDPKAKLVDTLVDSFRDENAARARFAQSALVKSLFPPAVAERTLGYFAHQRLINDLLFPRRIYAASRGISALHGVLTRTDLSFPALLLLDSDPDAQRALARVGPALEGDPEALKHRSAALLAARDYAGAAPLLRQLEGTGYERSASALLQYLARTEPSRRPSSIVE